jgi:hypothetical protein
MFDDIGLYYMLLVYVMEINLYMFCVHVHICISKQSELITPFFFIVISLVAVKG